jgi:hypothetical protein
MSHLISAVENALLAGRWLDAAPLLSDILSEGVPCSLKPLEFYEREAGTACDSDKVRRILQTRMSLVDNRAYARMSARVREAERLASIVRDHGFPCRVVEQGTTLRVAGTYVSDNGRCVRVIEQVEATRVAVGDWLGYGRPVG